MLTPTFALVLFVSAAAFAVFGQALVLRAAFRGRTPAANATPASRVREVLWIALPALAVVLVVLATWRALPRRDVPPGQRESVPAIRTAGPPLAPAGA